MYVDSTRNALRAILLGLLPLIGIGAGIFALIFIVRAVVRRKQS